MDTAVEKELDKFLNGVAVNPDIAWLIGWNGLLRF